MIQFSIKRPSDFHVHFRDEDLMHVVSLHTAKQMHYATIMPNLMPPIVNCRQAEDYYNRIIKVTKDPCPHFTPLMTLYLTPDTTIDDIAQIQRYDMVHAIKLYPQGVTTNSDGGIKHICALGKILDKMSELRIPLLVHGEVPDPAVDIFDREKLFISEILEKIIHNHPELDIVMEHITTKDAADYVQASGPNIAATITAHHLLYDRNDLLSGGIKPHYYCLPILKRQKHRMALLDAATSGSSKFFAGSDSAPHLQQHKELSCGCAGCYTACNAIELYAHAFHKYCNLSLQESQTRFEKFMSINGCHFYNLPIGSDIIRIQNTSNIIETEISTKHGNIIPLSLAQQIDWSII